MMALALFGTTPLASSYDITVIVRENSVTRVSQMKLQSDDVKDEKWDKLESILALMELDILYRDRLRWTTCITYYDMVNIIPKLNKI